MNNTTNNKPNERVLWPIVTADVLLSSDQYKKIIDDIHRIVDLADNHFSILYWQLIKAFVEFVQLLPANNSDNMLNNGLSRALTAIQLQNEANDDQPDPLFVYVLFSAALLLDIGFITNNRTIIISTKDGTFIKEWLPHKGPMPNSPDNYYRIRSGGGTLSNLSRNLTPLFARQIMPRIGFNWLAQDSATFATWLALLNNEDQTPIQLKLYLDRANEKITNQLPQERLKPIKITPLTPSETILSEDFIEWLKNSIQNNTTTINTYNSNIHVVENGLFLELPKLIKQFCAKSPKHPPEEQVFEQLKKIGFFNLAETKNGLVQYKYTNTQNFLPTFDQTTNTIRQGVIVSLPCFLFSLYPNYLVLPFAIDFTPIESPKEKAKKKAKLVKKLRARRRRIERLNKEIEEALLVQMKMNLQQKE